jgi:hypothetical protein
MAIVANVRVNASAPFPATVKGGGLIAVTKANGIWTVSLNFAAVPKIPVLPDPANSYVPAWNALTGAIVMVPIGNVNSNKVVTTLAGGASPYAAQPNDDVLLINAVPFTVTVDWSSRSKPLRIVDNTGNASPGTPITITPKAGQTQMASLNYSYLIDGNGGSITLTPLPAGTGAY